MDIDLFIKHTFRLLPIYEKAQVDNDYSNYIQSIDYSLSEMSDYSDNKVINNVLKCLNELKVSNEYNHFNVKKTVFYCCNKLSSLKK